MDSFNIRATHLALAVMASYCCYCLHVAAQQQIYKKAPAIINFGDSNSDTGGGDAAGGYGYDEPSRPADGRAFFSQPTGRLCDGRLIVDFLCESVGTSYLHPYLDAVGMLGTNFSSGANFAIAGAATIFHKLISITLKVQLNQFRRFRFLSLSMSSARPGQLVDHSGFEAAVFIIDIGQNDIGLAFLYNKTYHDIVNKTIPHAVNNIRNAMLNLYAMGARKFWIHNTGPLGCLPAYVGISDERDPVGCLVLYNDAARAFNTRLATTCDLLRARLADATIVYVDLFSIKYDVIANSTAYGFDGPRIEACYGYYELCPLQSRYISWDAVHYTEAANAIIATKVASGHYSKPPLSFRAFYNL